MPGTPSWHPHVFANQMNIRPFPDTSSIFEFQWDFQLRHYRYCAHNWQCSLHHEQSLQERPSRVWDWIDYRWEQGFKALLKFKRREGHCHVPIFHSEGDHRLGWWVSTQRQRRKELSAKQKARLNKIGFVWNENMGADAYSRTPRSATEKKKATKLLVA